METLKKYFDEKDLEFIKKAQTFFNKKLFFECSFKIMNNDKVDKRYIIGLQYNKDNLENYWKFMDVKPIKTPLNHYDIIYMGLDLSNNLKKIYFEKNNYGGHCFEVLNEKVNLKSYYLIDKIPDEIFNILPKSLLAILNNNINFVAKCSKDKITVYHIALKKKVDYNDDFELRVMSLAFDENYNILYHTYYVRLKDIMEFEKNKVN